MSTLSKARKDNKGAGIGLLLVKGFVENDGEIWVESKEGIGSTFFFTLPLNEPLFKIDSLDSIEFDKGCNLFLKNLAASFKSTKLVFVCF
jgi:hypothetical protein